ncbi:RNase adapter RapZ [Clostridium aminobutyricum]|uniref:RNase adapter RapZ n=1 Tax=Clostridium aminobutyricum TaxID=33953 RepID=A0A939IIU9_CLOAM|nr:RNase adapter RapZ [Clostridium aminobutyricum]MBN7772933.1 RNase adapter RapZ [Clostridium aminobutyricum]
MEAVIVTGLSGAGKSQAANCLEDLGYYCIDNMPPALIKNFMTLAINQKSSIEKAAFVIDIRGGEFFDEINPCLQDLKLMGLEYKILFLEASDEVLIRRFNETRRQHPLSDGGETLTGINREREVLASIRGISDFVIDTSNMKAAKLREEIKALFGKGEDASFVLNIFSFGFKHGIPLEADMVLDVRFIPNPYYITSLKKLTGNSKKIQDYVLKFPESQSFITNVEKMLKDMIPCYIREGKYHLNLAFGCTGGQHRSVTMANVFAEKFKKEGIRITIDHRDL